MLDSESEMLNGPGKSLCDRWIGVALLAGLASLPSTGCGRTQPVDSSRVEAVVVPEPVSEEIARLAREELAAVARGRYERSGHDDMLLFETQFPGFAGFYFGGGDVVALFKSDTATTAEEMRTLVSAYAARHARVTERMKGGERTQLRAANYSLSELVAVHRLVIRNSRSMPGWTGGGVDILRNGVAVFFEDSASLHEGLAHIHALGVPRAMLLPRIIGPGIAPVCVTTKARQDSLRARGRAGC